jgi:hypothetical protein
MVALAGPMDLEVAEVTETRLDLAALVLVALDMVVQDSMEVAV